MRLAFFCFLLAVAACGGGGTADVDADMPDAAPAPDCGSCSGLTFDVDVPRLDGSSIAVTEGASLPWVHGFQGGTMITPVVRFDPAEIPVGVQVDVTFTHAADPAAPSALGEVAGFPSYHLRVTTYDDHGRPAAGPFTDQLGWGDLDGVRMLLTVAVSSGGYSGSLTAAVSLVQDPTMRPIPHECDAFPPSGGGGGGCEYRTATGTAVVRLSPTMPGEPSCPDGRDVRVDFMPDAAADACSVALLGVPIQRDFFVPGASGYAPSASCLASLGIMDGTSVPATVQFETMGTCSPAILDAPMLDLSSCACP